MPQDVSISMIDDDLRLPGVVRGRLREEHDRQVGILATGVPKTLEDYRQAVGKLQGLKLAIEICDDVQKALGQR